MKLPKLPAKDDMPEMFTNPDIFVGELVNELLLTKDITKSLKKNLAIKCANGRILTWKISAMHTLEILKDYAMKQHPESIIINDLPIADVIKIYKFNKNI
jgi:hypothetical protein